MELSDGLRVILKGHLDWGKCRLACFIGMLLALVRLKRMNLTPLALAFASEADPKSRYRRLQRFFQEVVFDYDAIARLIMQLFDFYGHCWPLPFVGRIRRGSGNIRGSEPRNHGAQNMIENLGFKFLSCTEM